jgi:hypothetical protein
VLIVSQARVGERGASFSYPGLQIQPYQMHGAKLLECELDGLRSAAYPLELTPVLGILSISPWPRRAMFIRLSRVAILARL